MKKELTADKHRYTQILRNDMGLQISNFNFKKSAFICVYLWINNFLKIFCHKFLRVGVFDYVSAKTERFRNQN